MSDTGFRVSPQQNRQFARNQAQMPAIARYRISGPMDLALLKQVLQALVDRHEILRTRFVRPPGLKSYLQVVEPQVPVLLEPLGETPGAPVLFDLTQVPLFRFRATVTGSAETLLELTVASVCCDARSFALWMEDLAYLCTQISAGAAMAESELQFLQFSEWWNDAAAHEEDHAIAANARALWGTLGDTEPLNLPFALSGRSGQAITANAFSLDQTPLRERCQARGRSLESLCFSVWQALLYRLADQRQLPLYWQIDARKFEDLAHLAGPLSESLPFVKPIDGTQSLEALWARNYADHEDAVNWLEFYDAMPSEREGPLLAFAYHAYVPPHRRGDFEIAMVSCHAASLAAGLSLACSAGLGALNFELFGPGLEPRQLQETASQLRGLLEAAEAFDRPLDLLDLRGADERAYWDAFQGESVAPPAALVLERFRAQARREPERQALICSDRRLSYGELDTHSNHLAHALRARGVTTDQLVAVSAGRDAWFFVALLAIWKAGGAYVPLDAKMPPARTAQILAHLGCQLWLSSESSASYEGVSRLDPASDGLGQQWPDTDPTHVHENQLAYAIMTSGSTGAPKAVLVEHQNLANYVAAAIDRLALTADATFGHISALFADLGHTMLFPALALGGCLRVFSAEAMLDPQVLLGEQRSSPIDYLKIAPTHLASILSADSPLLLPRRGLILGGEAASKSLLEQVRRLAPDCRIYNHYGPSETTVGVLAKAVDDGETVPALGRPLSGIGIELRNRHGAPVPRGVLGEIWISGKGVGRGYHASPAQTAARFIPAPDGGRFYRTGDLARLDPDGRLMFVGRRDQQVKVRGFRVEPAEIEMVLRAEPGVLDAAVVALQREGSGGLVLVAYVVAEQSERIQEHLTSSLAKQLPEHLRPQHLVFLKNLPYTANGKLAHKSLPSPLKLECARAYRPPQNPVQEVLCRAWAEVLGRDKVGIDDNYFELGGDSITSIQIMSRARRYGVALVPKLLFDYPNIARLAELCDHAHFEMGTNVEGELEPGPIQQWFFGLGLKYPQHWNMSIFIEIRQPLDPFRLARAVDAMVAQHDGLRLCFDQSSGKGHYRPSLTSCFEQRDLPLTPEFTFRPWLETAAAAEQASLNLAEGPLFKVVLFDAGKQGQRLLLVAHHLLVDGVSWRILLEDLASAYGALALGKQPDLGPKTLSAKDWLRASLSWAQSEEARVESEYWLQPEHTAPLPRDGALGNGCEGDTCELSFSLDQAWTGELTQRLPATCGVQVGELLVFGLAQALSRWTGSLQVQLWLEGHGRESLGALHFDLSRSVGWFTSHFPVQLELPSEDMDGRLRAVVDQLRAVPNKGVGYGMLRYLGPTDIRSALEARSSAEVRFNYLGRVGQDQETERLFGPAAESPGPQRHKENRRTIALAINAYVRDGRLTVRFDFDPGTFAEARIARVAADFESELLALLGNRELTAIQVRADAFPAAQLDQKRLGRALDTLAESRGQNRYELLTELEDLYRLSPIQQGILFHSLLDAQAGLFFRQMSWTIKQRLDASAFRQAWTETAAQHAAMRTGFFLSPEGVPLQAVFREVNWDIQILDWCAREPQESENQVQAMRTREQEQGFQLANAPLSRLKLIQTGPETWRVIWSYHHLILDGWSKYLFLKQVLEAYHAKLAGEQKARTAVTAFRAYVQWLQRRDQEPARAFWRNYLHGARPLLRAKSDGQPAQYDHHPFRLDPDFFARLQAFGRAHQLTLNSLVQTAWAAILGYFSGEDEVLYGTTVSGRPAELLGVETIVGPFIDTLPVRCQLCRARSLLDGVADMQARLADINHFAGFGQAELRQIADLPGSGPLFDSLVVFYNYPVDEVIHRNRAALSVSDIQFIEEDNFPLGLSARVDQTLHFDVRWDRSITSASWVERAAALVILFLEQLLEAPTSDRTQLEARFSQRIQHLDAQEKQNYRQQRFTRRVITR